MDRGVWWATVYGATIVAKHKVYIDMQEGVIMGIGSYDDGG